MSDRQNPFAKDSPKIRKRVSSPKTIPQRFANVSVRPKAFTKDFPTRHFAKNHPPKISQRVSSPKTIRQRLANDSPTCPFARNHSPNIRQRVMICSPKFFPKDWPTCQFAKNHSPNISQRVSSPITIRERFANVSVQQKPFPKDSPKIRQRVS